MSGNSSEKAVASDSEGTSDSIIVLYPVCDVDDDQSNGRKLNKTASSAERNNKSKRKENTNKNLGTDPLTVAQSSPTTTATLSPIKTTEGTDGMTSQSRSTTKCMKDDEVTSTNDHLQGTKRPSSPTTITLPSPVSDMREKDSPTRKNRKAKKKKFNISVTSSKNQNETVQNPTNRKDETREPRGTSRIFSKLFAKSNKPTKNEWWLRSGVWEDEARQEHQLQENQESAVDCDHGTMVMVFYDRVRISRKKEKRNGASRTTALYENNNN
eukprot:jgi/Psemu1/301784/fgenesh1_kg.44_\